MKKQNLRLFFSYFIFTIFILLILYRLLSLNNSKKLQNNKKKIEILRGVIFDRNNKILATSKLSTSIFANPEEFDYKEIPKKIDLLSQYLKISKNELFKRLKLNRKFNWLKRQLPIKIEKKIENLNMKGIFFKKEYKRIYPYKYSFSQILGFTKLDGNGIEGLEYTFNSLLKGNYFEKKNRFGYNLHLTIDSRIQEISRNVLKKGILKYQAKSGSIIILNAYNSEILALINYPDYNNNYFTQYSPELYKNLAILNYYEPGSIFKFIVASIALEENIITTKELIFCPKKLILQNREIKRSVKNNKATIKEILKKSCNVGIIQIAERIPLKIFYKYLKKYGLGQKTEINLSGENKGYLKSFKEFTENTKINMSFGYEIGITPIQIAQAFAVIANKGLLIKPQIIKKISDFYGNILLKNKIEIKHRVLSIKTADLVRKLLLSVLEKGGTGFNAKIDGMNISGKTGSAQIFNFKLGKYEKNQVNTTFIAIVPQIKNKLVIVIMLHRPKYSPLASIIAAPLFKKLISKLIAKGLIWHPKWLN